MENKEFGKYLEGRTKDFAIRIIKMSSSMNNSPENKVIRDQIIRSGTSIGANYREANASRSKADFLNRIRICQGEANETIYWIEILMETSSGKINHIQELYCEAKELFAIFSSITGKLKSNK
jgi:four helix bundle protein